MECSEVQWTSFAFLSRSKVVVPTIGLRSGPLHCLMAIDFRMHPNTRTAFEDVHFDCTFDLPSVRSGGLVYRFDIQANPSPTWVPLTTEGDTAPFHTSSHDRIFLCTSMVGGNDEIGFLQLFVPSTTLLSHLSTISPSTGQHLPWELWGPEGTRMRRAPRSHPASSFSRRVRFVSGMTYVAPFHHENGRRAGRTDTVQILNFNPIAIRHAVSKGQKRVDEDGYAIVTRPTTVKLPEVFETGYIRTSLPFRWKSVDLPWEFSSVNVTEDGLVIHHGVWSTLPCGCALTDLMINQNFIATDAENADEYRILAF